MVLAPVVLGIAVLVCIQSGWLVGEQKELRILSVRLGEVHEDKIFIEVVTAQDIYLFDNSEWAIQVSLRYGVREGRFAKKYHAPEDALTIHLRHPYYAKRQVSTRITEEGFLTIWSLPVTDVHTDIHSETGITHEYDLRNKKPHTITLELYGATIARGHLVSVPHCVEFPSE